MLKVFSVRVVYAGCFRSYLPRRRAHHALRLCLDQPAIDALAWRRRYSRGHARALAGCGRAQRFVAGAAAGAALGSVVPVVGTAIGGLIGGALGYWGGSKAGEAVGEGATSLFQGGGGNSAKIEEASKRNEDAKVISTGTIGNTVVNAPTNNVINNTNGSSVLTT